MHSLLLALLCAGLVLSTIGPRPAPAADSLDALLERVRTQSETERGQSLEREARFREARDAQQALLAEARAALAAERERGEALRERFELNEAELAEQEQALEQALGELGTLHGVVRQVAGDTRALLEESLITAQQPDRVEPVRELANSRSLPAMAQLEALWLSLMEEMVASGEVARFEAPVIRASGEETPMQVTRVGPFSAVADGRFLRYLPESGRLMEPARQPPARLQSQAAELESATGGTVAFPVDPTRGALLALLVRTPDTRERVEQGGVVGFIILALGAVALLLALERAITLGLLGRKVDRQLRSDKADPGNPLGRILGVYTANPNVDAETLGLKLDEAILREAPRVQRGLGALSILAGVAPLLGLLGTVTGMIKTFQVITLYGAGDPRLMSGGISEALVTTVLGLVVAIPIVLVHSFLNARANRIIQVLDEKSAALVAELAERRHARPA